MKLLTSSSAKLDKSQTKEWLNAVMYLEPSVDYKVICKASSKACRESCLTHSGMMRMSAQTNARVTRTKLLLENKEQFIAQLDDEITAFIRKAEREGKRLALRLNGTSDLDWTSIYAKYPQVQFYEYTKRPDLVLKAKKCDNVLMTFSRTETTKDSTIARIIEMGTNVAVVFDDLKPMPNQFKGIPVIDGDAHDRRYEDSGSIIIGLHLKGTLKVKQAARESGFAV